MNKTLVEGKYGHGAVRCNPIKRFCRTNWRKLTGRHIKANASQPFPWATGTNTITKIGGMKVKNQGQSFSCGRQAGSYGQYTLRRLEGYQDTEISAKSGYGQYCSSGGGMTTTQVETCIGAWGANLESEVPSYDSNGNPLNETQYEDTSWATPALVADAFTRAGYTPFNVNIDMDSMAWAIDTYGFIICMVRGQNNGTWDSNNPQPPSKNNSNALWEHWLYFPIGVQKNNIPTLTFLNSWGPNVGTQGYQDITQNYLDAGGILECIAFVKDDSIIPSLGNNDIWASVCLFFRKLWGLTPQLV